MWRQGDVMLERVAAMPAGVTPRANLVLVEGELTGHRHEIADPESAKLFEREGTLFLDITALEAQLVHPEHGPITLPRGLYRAWRQREYRPAGNRFVAD